MPGAFESLQKLKQNASLQQVQDILSTDLDLLCVATSVVRRQPLERLDVFLV